jgi:hypothetical protein
LLKNRKVTQVQRGATVLKPHGGEGRLREERGTIPGRPHQESPFSSLSETKEKDAALHPACDPDSFLRTVSGVLDSMVLSVTWGLLSAGK